MYSSFDLYFYTFSIFDAFANPYGHSLAPDRDAYAYGFAFAKPVALAYTDPDALPVAFTLPLTYANPKPDAITVADSDT